MINTQIQLSEEEKNALQSLANKTGKSIEELIQKAIDTLLEQHQQGDRLAFLLQGRGMWKDHRQLSAVEQLRSEWDRQS